MKEEVGLVLGTKDASPLEFWVGVSKNKYLELDDVIEVTTSVPGGSEKVSFYGVVDHVRKIYEGAQFDSDTVLANSGLIPVDISYAAFVKVTRVEPEKYIPPHPGDKVYKSDKNILDKGLYFDRMKKRIPVGIMRNGGVVYSNLEFIDGEKGAHVSISGISGVATKTSYALFFLYSLFNSIDKKDASSTHAIIFNVKGEDLLFLDKFNKNLTDADKEKYKILNLPYNKPFEGVKFYAPTRPTNSPYEIEVFTEKRKEGIKPYFWTIREIAKNRILRFLFSTGGEEEISTLMHAIRKVEDKLYELSKIGSEQDPLIKGNFEINTLLDLKISIEHDPTWFEGGNVASQTISAFLRRLDHAAHSTGSIIRPFPQNGYERDEFNIRWDDARLTVIDVNRLDAYSKMFVVGVTINEIFKKKEMSKTSRPLVFIMLDELNKYAPRSGWSPIKELLLDIAERGRSLGIILIGAQQTASEVEKRIFANSAIKVVGRLDPAEADHNEYDFLTSTLRKRAIMINSGTMIYHQPDVPVPLLLRFPFPIWATKKDEVETDGNISDLDFLDE